MEELVNDRGPPPDVTVHSVTLVTPVVSDFITDGYTL